jgi:hypothetical protein
LHAKPMLDRVQPNNFLKKEKGCWAVSRPNQTKLDLF